MIKPEETKIDNMLENRFIRLATAAAFASLLTYAMTLFAIPACLNKIGSQYNLPNSRLGLFQPAMMAGFIVAVLAVGTVSDRKGKLPTIGLGCIFLALGVLLYVWSGNFNILILAAFLMGMGGGSSEATAMALVADLYADSKRTAMANFSQTIFAVGSVFTPIIVGLLLKVEFPWQYIFYAIGVLAVLSSLPAFFAMAMKRENLCVESGSTSGWKRVITNGLILWLALGISLYVGAELGQSYWLARYFKLSLHASDSLAASSLSYLWFGVIIGRLTAAWFSKHISEMNIIIGSLIFAVIFSFVLLVMNNPVFAIFPAIGLGIFLGPLYPTILSRAINVFPERSGTVTAIIAAAGAMGGAIFPPVVGFISDGFHVSLRIALGLVTFVLLLNLGLFTRLRHKERT